MLLWLTVSNTWATVACCQQ